MLSKFENRRSESQIEELSSRLKLFPNGEFEEYGEDDCFLGSGSFGEVHKYFHKDLELVAIKQFRITGSAKMIKRAWDMVQLESKFLCRIQHPNIVKIVGMTKFSKAIGIIMEYVDGGDLKDLLFELGDSTLTWSIRLQIALGLVSALSYIHNYKVKKMICHGDLKPENVLLTKARVVKLADFGAATLHRATGASATSLDIVPTRQHTLLYAAPEYLKDLSLERHPSMDMYSYGLILYELISRRVPYYDCPLPGALPELIIAGIKPNMKLIDQVENRVDSSNDRSVFNLFKNLMERCWMDVPALRPSSKAVQSEVRNCMQKYDQINTDHATAESFEKSTPGKQQNATVTDQDNEIQGEPEKTEDARPVSKEVISIIKKEVNASHDDLLQFVDEFKDAKRYLELIPCYVALASLHEREGGKMGLGGMRDCIEGMLKAGSKLINADVTTKWVVKSHVISLMRNIKDAMEEVTSVDDITKCRDVLEVLDSIALGEELVGDLEAAEETRKVRVARVKELFGNEAEERERYGDTLEDLGAFYKKISRFDDAASCYRKAIEIYKAAIDLDDRWKELGIQRCETNLKHCDKA